MTLYAFQNGFHHEKGQILFLKLGISALGHQIPFWSQITSKNLECVPGVLVVLRFCTYNHIIHIIHNFSFYMVFISFLIKFMLIIYKSIIFLF